MSAATAMSPATDVGAVVDAHRERALDAIDLARIEFETLRSDRDAATTPEAQGRMHALMDQAMDRWGKALGARDALDALAAELAGQVAS